MRKNSVANQPRLDAADTPPQQPPQRSVSFKHKIREHWKTLISAANADSLSVEQRLNHQRSQTGGAKFAAAEINTSGGGSRKERRQSRNLNTLFPRQQSNKPEQLDEEASPDSAEQKGKRGSGHKWGATFLNIVVEVLKFKRAGIPLDEAAKHHHHHMNGARQDDGSQSEWFQLGGHQGTFKEGRNPGWVMKLFSENEYEQYKLMQSDPINKLIPKCMGVCSAVKPGLKEEHHLTNGHQHSFIELEDLLSYFSHPNVMDVKMGVRTYTEDELTKTEQCPNPRKDLFLKMISIDDTQPTKRELEAGAVLKSRYMIWREDLSSSATLGFRIEAIKRSNDQTRKEYHRLKSRAEIKSHLNYFVNSSGKVVDQFVKRLSEIKTVLSSSQYFKTHEFIGSSLLFVYDNHGKAGVWMIDFAKTEQVHGVKCLTHTEKWKQGNHEDGYMTGLDNLISIFTELVTDFDGSSPKRRRSSLGPIVMDRKSFLNTGRKDISESSSMSSEPKTVDL